MKNIYVLPSSLESKVGDLIIWNGVGKTPHHNQNIYITSDEEIKEGDKFIESDHDGCGFRRYKVILTTDQEIIKEGVQEINDEFLEWFVKNPTCEFVEVQKWFDGIDFLENKIIIPKEKPKQHVEFINNNIKEFDNQIKKSKQETLEEAAEKEFPLLELTKYSSDMYIEEENLQLLGHRKTFVKAAKYIEQRMYSEEDLISLLEFNYKKETNQIGKLRKDYSKKLIKEWFEQFKK